MSQHDRCFRGGRSEGYPLRSRGSRSRPLTRSRGLTGINLWIDSPDDGSSESLLIGSMVRSILVEASSSYCFDISAKSWICS